MDIKTHILLSAKINQVSPILVGQLTDLHLFADENQKLIGMPTALSLQAVIERLRVLKPELDLLLLTGDLSGDSTHQSYENLLNLINQVQIPTYWIPGNHDCAIAMNQVLNLRLVSQRKSFERGGWNFILLNSSVPGCVHGYLSVKTLQWLDSQLKMVGSKPTLVALHHPPFYINSDWLDTSRLQNAEEFFAILDNYPQVKIVLFGHIHQEFHYQRHNINYLGTPSTCIQFKPESSIFAVDKKPPGFRLLKLYPNGTWETQVERVPYYHAVDLAATGY